MGSPERHSAGELQSTVFDEEFLDGYPAGIKIDRAGRSVGSVLGLNLQGKMSSSVTMFPNPYPCDEEVVF